MSEYIISDELNVLRQWIPKLTEIVRCRDCKHSYEATWPAWSNIPHDYLDCCGELVETWDYYNDQPNMNPVKPDGFCAWGERREA